MYSKVVTDLVPGALYMKSQTNIQLHYALQHNYIMPLLEEVVRGQENAGRMPSTMATIAAVPTTQVHVNNVICYLIYVMA